MEIVQSMEVKYQQSGSGRKKERDGEEKTNSWVANAPVETVHCWTTVVSISLLDKSSVAGKLALIKGSTSRPGDIVNLGGKVFRYGLTLCLPALEISCPN
jgi:hypothetical protein